MLYRLVRPMMREGSRNAYFQQRIPADAKALAVGLRLALPVGDEFFTVTVSKATNAIKVSLRTADPSEAKVRQAKLGAHLESVWVHLKAEAPVSFTHKQAVALAGELYRAWAGEGRRETTTGMVRIPLGRVSPGEAAKAWAWQPDNSTMDDEAGIWAKAAEFLDRAAKLDAGKVFGPIIDHLLSRKGIYRVDPESRELLLEAFQSALKDALEARERNAAGDYRPDPKAERFPAFETPASPLPSPAPSRKPKASLNGLFEAWKAEATAAGRTESTFDSYARTFRLLGEFLGHDDAASVTRDDITRFKDHRLAQGLRLKTVRDSDLSALKSVLGWALSNGRLAANPATGIKLMVAKQVRTRERDFTKAETKAILGHALGYSPGANESAKVAAAKRWVPWVCAYTGARVGEIVQLRKQDVEKVEGAWTINITPEAGTVKDKEARRVVLHAHFMELGFVGFVESAEPGYLFLNAAAKDGPESIRGKWRSVKNRLVDFVREVLPDAEIAPNHGWRHTFKTLAREAGMDPDTRDAICGHAPATVGAEYGRVSVAAQVKAFEKFPRFEL